MKKNIFKTFSLIFIITVISKFLGLFRDIVFAKYYGTGYVANAFFAAIRIPTQLVDIILSSAIVSTFVPIFNQVLQKDGKDKANKFANNFVNIVALISTAIAIIGIIFAPQIVKALAGGFDTQTFNLTVELIKITFPMIIFTAIAYSLVGFLQSYGQFNIPAMISAVSNLVIIIFLLLYREKFGIHGVAGCMLFAWLLQVLIQVPFAKKYGYPFIVHIDFKDENIKRVFLLSIPILISTAVLPINNLVSTRLASGMGDNAVSAMEYAYKLYVVISGVFTYAIGNIIFPEMSRASADDNKEEYKEIINKAMRMMIYILIPLTIGITIFSKDIISVIYERGEFTVESTLITSSILTFFSVGIIGSGIVEVMNKAFYAKQDTKSPLIAGIIMIIINVILCVTLSKFLDVKGLALATSITAIVNAITLMYMANKNVKIITKELGTFIAKVVISALVMGGVVYLLNNYLQASSLINIFRMIIGAAMGVVTYYLMTYLLKANEIKLFKKTDIV